MRFELFLIELPKAPLAKVQSALAELPKGASTGTILKSIEARKVPTVSVAWSDDKRVLNEVMDTLVDLGAGVKLVDHGNLIEKLATFAAEKAGRARYLEDDDDPESRKYIKMKQPKKKEALSEAFLRHGLTYFLQLCAAGVLFIWYVALRVGMERVFSTPALWPELGACAVGLLVAYVSTSSVRAVQGGRLTVLQIVPQLVLGAALTVASFFFLAPSVDEQQVADGKVKRPPSLPFAGLITELQNRKLAREASGRDSDEENGGAAELAGAAGEEEEDALWCERPEPAAEAVCEGGRGWDEALACLPQPEALKADRSRVAKKRKPIESAPEERYELAEEAPLPVERPWGVTLNLSTVGALAAMWLLSLLGLYLQLRPRRKQRASAVQGSEAESDAPTVEAAAEIAAEPAPATPSPELVALQSERAELRTALDEALTALATGQTGAAPDGAQRAELEQELGQARSAIAELKRELTMAAMRESALNVELSEVRLELGQEASLPEPGHAAHASIPRADNDGGRNTGLTRQLPPDADESSYSSNQVQEERVVLGKRRRP